MKSNFRRFNDLLSKAICEEKVEWTNEYTPKVRSTVRPTVKLSYNEQIAHIQTELYEKN